MSDVHVHASAHACFCALLLFHASQVGLVRGDPGPPLIRISDSFYVPRPEAAHSSICACAPQQSAPLQAQRSRAVGAPAARSRRPCSREGSVSGDWVCRITSRRHETG